MHTPFICNRVGKFLSTNVSLQVVCNCARDYMDSCVFTDKNSLANKEKIT